ncbi:MAG: MlaE family lipid ABC transporter permease subunit [Nitrospirota bacterium]|jgi:phospholipid/cholesterol/gamma-HCH transport system permease protein
MKENNGAGTYKIGVEGERGGSVAFFLSGRLDIANLESVAAELEERLREMRPRRLSVDLAGLDYMDSTGALALIRLEEGCGRNGVPVDFLNMRPEAKGVLELIDPETLRTGPLIPMESPFGPLERLGDLSTRDMRGLAEGLIFLGALLKEIFSVVLRPWTLRWRDVLFSLKRAGLTGVPIVGLIGFLMGLIVAFLSAIQLQEFGADIFVASLVAIGIVRELGPIMTAIVVAGRSGSAYAAEIGTMQVNDEVDALVTMGFEPVRFLAVPKVLATMAAVPLLTVYADLAGILGGLFIGVIGLDVTASAYLEQTRGSIYVIDMTTSLVKAVVFAFIIAAVGCHRGFRVRGGAEEVGAATTSAVVAAIFFIIVVDAVFAVVLHYAGWEQSLAYIP